MKQDMKKMLEVLKKNKILAFSVLVLFFLGVLFGIIVNSAFPEISENFIAQLEENPQIQTIMRNLQEKPLLASAQIFSNNFFVSLLIIFSGFLVVFPALILFSNSFVIGIVSAFARAKGASLLLLLPHGIFELPAILLASFVGFYITKLMLLEGKKGLKKFFKKQFFSFLLVIIILLIIAAIIETIVGYRLSL